MNCKVTILMNYNSGCADFMASFVTHQYGNALNKTNFLVECRVKNAYIFQGAYLIISDQPHLNDMLTFVLLNIYKISTCDIKSNACLTSNNFNNKTNLPR